MAKSLKNTSAWSWFSKYVRLRDSDERGYCKCITCGATKHWKEMHAGHFEHNRNAIFFDERNVNAQCNGCNTYKGGDLGRYALALQEKYGVEIPKELTSKKFTPKKYSKEELKEIVNYCKEQVDFMLSKKLT